MAEEPTGVVIARVTITRVLTDDDMVDYVRAESEDGTELGLAEALGMLRLGEHTLIQSYNLLMGEELDDEDAGG